MKLDKIAFAQLIAYLTRQFQRELSPVMLSELDAMINIKFDNNKSTDYVSAIIQNYFVDNDIFASHKRAEEAIKLAKLIV